MGKQAAMWLYIITMTARGSGERSYGPETRRERESRRGTHVNGHLNARLGASALEDNVKTVGHVKVRECSTDGVFCPTQLVFCCLGLVSHGETVRFLGKSLLLCKVKTLLVDVDSDDMRGTV